VCCGVLQCGALCEVCCDVLLQCVAVCCNGTTLGITDKGVLECVGVFEMCEVCCSVLQCVVVCCNGTTLGITDKGVLECVGVC